jgi:type I restriction enzyme S subunit
MQKIFSHEIRFKDDNGNSYQDWENKKLGHLCDIRTGKLNANASDENGKYRFYTCAKNYFQIDKYEFDTDALIISGNGANVGYIHHFNGKFNAYQRTYVLDKFKLNIYYLKHFLNKNLFRRIYKEKKDGATPYIVMSTLFEMSILVPEANEQKKIADFLSSLDEKIGAASAQLEKTKEFKKGLLQQMFV